jgi:hypothetical protein
LKSFFTGSHGIKQENEPDFLNEPTFAGTSSVCPTRIKRRSSSQSVTNNRKKVKVDDDDHDEVKAAEEKWKRVALQRHLVKLEVSC